MSIRFMSAKFLSVCRDRQVIFIRGKRPCIPEGADSHTVAKGSTSVS